MKTSIIAALTIAAAVAVAGAVFILGGTPDNGPGDANDARQFGTEIDTGDASDNGASNAANNTSEEYPFTITYVIGSEGAYTVTSSGSNYTVTFSGISEASEYTIAGILNGNIVIDAGENDFELSLAGVTITSTTEVPIYIASGEDVSISAKKNTTNYVYDKRTGLTEDDTSASIYSKCDLKLKGNGKLVVISANGGIHSKDNLSVKNLTLYVTCEDNCLKGNDGVKITSGTITLNALSGDVIKTVSTDLSSKGIQRGSVTVNTDDGDTELKIRAYADGIDAAFDVMVEETAGNKLDIDIVSGMGAESEAGEGTSNIPTPGDMEFDPEDFDFPGFPGGDGTFDPSNMPGRDGFDFSDFEFPEGFDPNNMPDNGQGRPERDGNRPTPGDGSQDGGWTRPGDGNFQGGNGGFTEGNKNKVSYSCKGIKAGNAVYISSGDVSIDSFDDAIHANNEDVMESGATPLGNVVVSGGALTISTSDDGIHADGTLTISGGSVNITTSYEGLEEAFVNMTGGDVSIVATDDGINGVSASNDSSSSGIITLSGGTLFINALGDGIDSNSRTSYGGINFAGTDVIIVSSGMSTGGADSSIDAESGYSFTGGTVLAVGSTGFMNEVKKLSNWDEVATILQTSISDGDTVTVTVDGSVVASVDVPFKISKSYIVFLGTNQATISVS